MNLAHRVFNLASLLVMSVPLLNAQQVATPLSVLTGAVVSLGSGSIRQVTLTGSSESISGSTDDTGTFSATCNLGGTSQLNLLLSRGSRTETRLISNGIPSGTWADSEGVQHSMVAHNLYGPASWFCPSVALAQIVSANNMNVEFVGEEEKNGGTLEHFTITSIPPGSGPSITMLTHLSQLDVYIDPMTFRPIVFDFNVHPDKDAGTDIPIEVVFSNYTQVHGMWIPFTVQRFLNSSLALTLQVQSATPSSGSATVE